MGQREVRPKTAMEKEWEGKPICPYDPLSLMRCGNHVFPPGVAICDKCLTEGMLEAIDDNCAGRAVQMLIAYKNLIKTLQS